MISKIGQSIYHYIKILINYKYISYQMIISKSKLEILSFNLTFQSIPLPIISNFNSMDPAKRYELELLEMSNLIKNPIYMIELQNFKISASRRAKCFHYITQNFASQKRLRTSCAYAKAYFDRYIKLKGKVQLSQMSDFIIACMRIAVKFQQRSILKIELQERDKKNIFNWQLQILQAFNFHLNEPTYINYAHRMMAIWNIFAKQDNKYQLLFGQQYPNTYLKCRCFYQQLDWIYADMQFLRQDIEEIVLNLFYIHTRLHCQHIYMSSILFNSMRKINDQLAVNRMDKFNEDFMKFIQLYSSGTKTSNLSVRQKIIIKIISCLEQFNLSSINFMENEDNFKQQFKTFHFAKKWDLVQTNSIVNFVQKLNNHQRSRKQKVNNPQQFQL